MPYQKIFNQLWILVNLYQHEKNETGEILDLTTTQSEWLRTFWTIPLEQHFSQIEDLYRNTENNINFHYRTNLGKINDRIFIQLQKTLLLACFWPISPIFGGRKKLSQKIWQAQLDKVFKYHTEIQRNLMIQFQENNPTDSRMEGWIEHISWNPSSYCWGSNKYDYIRLALKSQRYRVRYRSNQKLLPHSQHAKN